MENSKLVSFENLPSFFYIELDIEFRNHLFNEARNNRLWAELAKDVGYSRDRLFCLRRGFRNLHNKKEKNMINVELVKQLAKIAGITLEKIEKHIIFVKSGDGGRPISLKLPIYESKELASLIAHEMGDGHLRERTFVYFNESQRLIDGVKTNIKKVFGNINPKEYRDEKGTRLVYPAVISRIIFLCGGVRFNKVTQDFDIPKWIKEGSDEIKISFIRSIFDDESYVNIEDKYITFQMASVDYCKKMMISLKKLLKDFDINTLLRHKGSYIDKENIKKNVFGITLGRFESINNYKTIIGFNHSEKQRQLEELIESYGQAKFIKYESIEKMIVDNMNAKNLLTINTLKNELNMTHGRVRTHLNSLYRKGIVNKSEKHPIMWRVR